MTTEYIRRAAALGALALLPLTAACNLDDTEPLPEARMQLQLTSDPSNRIESARVWISRIYMLAGENDSPEGREPLFRNSTEPLVIDLLSLVNGNTINLFDPDPVTIETGSYRSLRFVVDSAVVTLKPGFTFEDGSRTRMFTVDPTSSISASGAPVALDGAIVTREGVRTTLLLDFDVDESFRRVGPDPTTNGGMVEGFRFVPTIHEMSRMDQE